MWLVSCVTRAEPIWFRFHVGQTEDTLRLPAMGQIPSLQHQPVPDTTMKMDLADFMAILPPPRLLLVTLSIPPIVYVLYHFILFPIFRSDLRSIPGPFPAKITDLHRLWLVYTNSAHEHHLQLHSRHGPLVRLGPNNVSVSSPAAIPILYNTRTRFPKSSFYPVMGNVAHGKVVPTIFSTQDESVHEMMKRPIAQVYAMSNLKTYEPLVESTESVFFDKLGTLADEGKVLDLGMWMHWFAIDVIMEITFGERVGFLERMVDVDGIMEMIEKRFEYVAVIGQMPWLDKVLHKNPLVAMLSELILEPAMSPVLKFAVERIAERKKDFHDHPEKKGQGRDFLTQFLHIKESHPDIPDSWILSWCQQNVQAGSDSTAITLTAVIYYLLKNPKSMKQLLTELDNANLPSPMPWDSARKLPYLDACIKEALRMVPAIGIPLERVVPDGGIQICGRYFKSGTVLGVNASVVHRDKEVYRADAALWRPERWIEADEDKRKEMERVLFAFGGGSRVCLGRNISYLEMYKVIPELLTRFTFELKDPQKEWSLKNKFFVYTNGVEVTVKRRESSSY